MPLIWLLLSWLLSFQFSSAATPVDFSQYRRGSNNRPLFEAIVRDLVSEFGHPVTTAYRRTLQATLDKIIIDETEMDKYLRETESPTEREAIARFILAHEYFHILLKHPYARDSISVPKEIQITGPYSEARKQMERQVDYLAAKYLYKLGLPTEPVREMFSKHPELEGGKEYPSAQERSEIILLAKKPEIDESYFRNDVIHCTFLLGSLAAKLH